MTNRWKIRLAPIVLTPILALAIAGCSDRQAAPAEDPTATRTAETATTAPPAATPSPTEAATRSGEMSVAEVVQLAEPSVVRIESGGGVGTVLTTGAVELGAADVGPPEGDEDSDSTEVSGSCAALRSWPAPPPHPARAAPATTTENNGRCLMVAPSVALVRSESR